MTSILVWESSTPTPNVFFFTVLKLHMPPKPRAATSATAGHTKTERKDPEGRVIYTSDKTGKDKVRCKSKTTGKLEWRKVAVATKGKGKGKARRGGQPSPSEFYETISPEIAEYNTIQDVANDVFGNGPIKKLLKAFPEFVKQLVPHHHNCINELAKFRQIRFHGMSNRMLRRNAYLMNTSPDDFDVNIYNSFR